MLTQQILQTLKDAKRVMTPSEICEVLGVDGHRVRPAIWDLYKRGKINKQGHAKYVYEVVQVKKFEIVLGLELELEYNRMKMDYVECAGYHDRVGKYLSEGWLAESDGSLSSESFSVSDTVEIISVPTTLSDLKKRLEEFQRVVKAHVNDVEVKNKDDFSDYLSFNETTGAHAHIGLMVRGNNKTSTVNIKGKNVLLDGKQENIKSFVSVNFMKKVARELKKRIKNDMPGFYPEFIDRYFRRYARKMNINSRGRYLEFNYATNIPTIEYRSVHLCGIKKWSDFFKFYEILGDVLQTKFDEELKKNTPFSQVNKHLINIYVDDEVDKVYTDKISMAKTEMVYVEKVNKIKTEEIKCVI